MSVDLIDMFYQAFTMGRNIERNTQPTIPILKLPNDEDLDEVVNFDENIDRHIFDIANLGEIQQKYNDKIEIAKNTDELSGNIIEPLEISNILQTPNNIDDLISKLDITPSKNEEENVTKDCTYSITKNKPAMQYWAQCYQCFKTCSEGACIQCLLMCHRGHIIGPIRKSSFYCDCGHNNCNIKYNDDDWNYIGDIKDNMMHGYGELFVGDKTIYKGEWKYGKKNGWGTQYFMHEKSSNNINDIREWKLYEGEWQNNKYNGWGKLYELFAEKNDNNVINYYIAEIYVGFFRDGLPHGRGKLIASKNITVDAVFFHGKINGYCEITDDCMKFELLYEDGKQIKGKVFNDGEVQYCGGIKSMTRDGYGCGFFHDEGRNKWIFDGEWKKNEPQRGIYYNPSAKIYIQHIDNSNIGYLYNENKNIIYNGEFKNKIYAEGYGKEYDNDGNLVYKGNFKNGMRDGNGIEYYPNDQIKYKGNWQNNLKHGQGILYNEENEIIFSGFFEKDDAIEDEKNYQLVQRCNICRTNDINCALTCGHVFCDDCITQQEKCPNCAKIIENRIKLYL